MERQVARVALFAALVAALGLFKLTTPGGVPITAQSLGIMLCGTILGWRAGGLAALLFVCLVLAGLPLLAGGRGGVGLLVSPSVGFLAGFPFAAAATGIVVERLPLRTTFVRATIASLIGGILVLYVFGVLGWAWAANLSIVETIPLATLPYLPGDIIKAVICGCVTHGLHAARPSALDWSR